MELTAWCAVAGARTRQERHLTYPPISTHGAGLWAVQVAASRLASRVVGVAHDTSRVRILDPIGSIFNVQRSTKSLSSSRERTDATPADRHEQCCGGPAVQTLCVAGTGRTCGGPKGRRPSAAVCQLHPGLHEAWACTRAWRIKGGPARACKSCLVYALDAAESVVQITS